MKIQDLCDRSLRELHALIGEHLASEDRMPPGKRPYGVREYPDWKRQADAFEAAMAGRGVSFDPIDWGSPA